MMGKGYWLDPKTQQSWVVDRHERWVLENPKLNRLPPDVHQYLLTLNPDQEMDQIRLAASKAGLIRIRDYDSKISVQFSVDRTKIKAYLWTIFEFLDPLVTWKDTTIVLGNFATRDEVQLSFRDFTTKLQNDETIMREEYVPADIPIDTELSEKLKKAFGI